MILVNAMVKFNLLMLLLFLMKLNIKILFAVSGYLNMPRYI